MIPIHLTIEGLYSYRKKQEINFEKLTSNQLFGIFGAVGSGKSSILEAIIFAVYNETDRLNLRDNRYYNMMNLQANHMLIDFICWAGKHGKEKYRFIFEAKRNKKKFEEVKNSDRRVLKEIEGQWVAQEHYNITEIIGMNAKNFRQTVIIPQGKFRDFIEMSGKDRTEMLQELFQLDRFDLFEKTNRLISKTKEKILKLETRLETLATYTKEALKEKEAYAITLEAHVKEKKALLEEKTKSFEAQNKLKTLWEEKQQIKEWLAKQRENKERITSYEAFLQKYDLAERLFKEKLQQEKKLNNQINVQDDRIKSVAVQLNKITQECEEAEAAFQQYKQAYEKRDEEKSKLNDLEIIISIKETEAALERVKQEHKKLDDNKKQQFELLEKFKRQEKESAAEIKSLKEKSVDISDLKEAVFLLKQQTQAKQNLNTLKESLEKILADEKQEIASQEEILSEFLVPEKENPQSFFQQQLKAIDKELIHLASQEKYEKDRILLKDGTPCPLCGAIHHPNSGTHQNGLTQADNIAKGIEENQQKKLQIDKAFAKWQQNNSTLKSIEAVKQEKEKDIQNAEMQWRQIKEDCEGKGFSETDIADLTQQIIQQEIRSKTLKELENKLEELRNSIAQQQNLYERASEAFSKTETQKITSENSIAHSKSLLKVIQYEGSILQHDLPKLKDSYQRGEEKIANIEKQFQLAEEKKNELLLEKKGLESKLTVDRQNLSDLKKDLEEIRTAIHQSIVQEVTLKDLQEVKKLLGNDIDIKKEREKIEAFLKDWDKNSNRLQELETAIGKQTLDIEALDHLQNEILSIEEQIQELQNNLAVSKEQIKEAKEKLQTKKELQTELKKSQNRTENLRVLSNMFKGKGFVKYVSSIYLKNLVGIANQRFMQLTKNNLSLELNQNDDFMVRDYLNNGKTRLLKTLSGGQTFQASLCLALALAEHVKSLNTSEKSFFFLDEGFGTLDRQSLQIVFETLRTLQKENRIVGIISHVEELQQEIEVALHVDNHQEEGSIISYSWV